MDLSSTTNLKRLREDIATALAAVERLHGVKIDLGRIGYDRDGYSATSKVTILRNDGEVSTDDVARQEFVKYSYGYGLDPQDFNRTFEAVNRKGKRITLKITGVNTRARAKPILLEGSDGLNYSMSPDHVKQYLAKN